MKYFTYIVAVDAGCAPNPFYGFCTLAICKPQIRDKAKVGDWVVGLGSKSLNCRGHLIYAMRIKETMTFDKYWKDKRFSKKKPNKKSIKEKCGDNIYYKGRNGRYKQVLNYCHEKGDKRHDTKTENVLISDYFFYFGKNHIVLPEIFKKSINKKLRNYQYKGLEKAGGELINCLKKRYKKGRCNNTPIDYEKIKNECVVSSRKTKKPPIKL